MKRRLFTILSAMSLLLCATFAILWIMSYRIEHRYTVRSEYLGERDYVAGAESYESGKGELGVYFTKFTAPATHVRADGYRRLPPRQTTFASDDAPEGMTERWSLGTRYQSYDSSWIWHRAGLLLISADRKTGFVALTGHDLDGTISERVVVIRYWLLVALAAILPTTWAWRWSRRHRQSLPGLCPTCGYDLRATPGRCPECGATPPTGAAA